MSHYIVVPIRPASAQLGDGSFLVQDKLAKECLKTFWQDRQLAQEKAMELARKNPLVQFAVFGPDSIFETSEPKVIQKRMTESGEIVLVKE